MPSIKENIKEKLLGEIEVERQRLEIRIILNSQKPNYDQQAEKKFLEELKGLIESL